MERFLNNFRVRDNTDVYIYYLAVCNASFFYLKVYTNLPVVVLQCVSCSTLRSISQVCVSLIYIYILYIYIYIYNLQHFELSL